MIFRRKQTISMFVAASIVMASLSLASPLMRHHAQERNRTVALRPPAESSQTPEPLMRIALSTDVRAATISTTAKLLNASDLISEPQPLEVSRVRVESRMLSPTRPADENIEIVVARALARDEADRMANSVHTWPMKRQKPLPNQPAPGASLSSNNRLKLPRKRSASWKQPALTLRRHFRHRRATRSC